MTDFISREAAKTRIHDRAIEMALNNVGFNCDASFVIQSVSNGAKHWLDEVPAADVRPVARGKWKKRRFSELAFGYECSVCHTTWDAPTNFCPNCGANMDGGVNDATD